MAVSVNWGVLSKGLGLLFRARVGMIIGTECGCFCKLGVLLWVPLQ